MLKKDNEGKLGKETNLSVQYSKEWPIRILCCFCGNIYDKLGDEMCFPLAHSVMNWIFANYGKDTTSHHNVSLSKSWLLAGKEFVIYDSHSVVWLWLLADSGWWEGNKRIYLRRKRRLSGILRIFGNLNYEYLLAGMLWDWKRKLEWRKVKDIEYYV